ncbi:hypothetical protein AB1L30_14035 [Bremerella sp. JC817]|uniref:hypothetical protein n=1 Tax=Bremerella sp. JC817 TaxID=3231756 RepID=UPI003459A26C
MSSEADVLCSGYDVGYFDKADVARWADRWIEATDVPCDVLFDLSLNRSLHPVDLKRALRSLGSAEPDQVASTTIGFLGLLYEQKKVSAQSVVQRLFFLVHEPGLTNDETSYIYYLDDQVYHVAAGTWLPLRDVEEEVRGFLTPYAERLTVKYPEMITPGK